MVDQLSETKPAYKLRPKKPEFDFGRVMGRTFLALKDNFVRFFIPSMLIIGLPMILISLLPLVFGMTGGMMDGGDIGARNSWVMGSALISVGTMIVLLVGGVILQAALLYACFKAFNDEIPDMRKSLKVGMQFFWPLLGLSILMGLGVGLGILLLIIPGLILMVGWFCAAPAMVTEKLGISAAFERSWNLTSGYRWWILLFFIVLTIIGMVLGGVLGALSAVLGDPTEAVLNGATTSFIFANAIATGLAQALSVMLNAAGAAAVYFELRDLKEGLKSEKLAAIFD